MKYLKKYEYLKDDPVRPHLTLSERLNIGRIYYTGEEEDPDAIVCVAFLNSIPTKEEHLMSMCNGGRPQPMFGQFHLVWCPYTVWSYKKGAGRDIIFKLRDIAIEHKTKRLVTLSPKTDMAHKFHISNGAKLLSDNEETRNYEYEL
ncbi:MAG: hypothetical protein EBY41_00820 [Proteobacteria bacterium]|nr:hypothetical protein [Pseudomonadota bacterium]